MEATTYIPEALHASRFDEHSTTRLPRGRIADAIGPATSSEIIEGIESAWLCDLALGVSLHLARGGELVTVEAVDNDTVLIREFPGSPESMWARVRARHPGITLGKSLPRYIGSREYIARGPAILYGVLDLQSIAVVERWCDRETMRSRVQQLNSGPSEYVQEPLGTEAIRVLDGLEWMSQRIRTY